MNFLDLFAGIGGFRLGMERAGHKCVGYVEFDKFARQSYQAMHDTKGEWTAHDITRVTDDDIRQLRDRGRIDIICGGFPCQAFSIAGKRKGFDDTRGTLFFEIARFANIIRPRYLFLENVKGLLNHNDGDTFETILRTLDELGYDAEWNLCNSKDFGVPQNRERVFIVGHRRDVPTNNIFPLERIEINGREIEKVYSLSEGISRDKRLFQGISSERKEIFRTSLQRLFKRIQQELQTGESREIQEVGEEIRQFSEGSLQEIKSEYKRSQGSDHAEGICGVVRIPTEEMLLLWTRNEQASGGEGRVQQQDLQTVNRQNRFIKGVREGEFSSLLLAVQSYQGRLFYSIGDGRDWTKIYSKEVGSWNTTLSSILEEQVHEKYFLSQELTKRLTTQL